jgi:hypothetical protein
MRVPQDAVCITSLGKVFYLWKSLARVYEQISFPNMLRPFLWATVRDTKKIGVLDYHSSEILKELKSEFEENKP